MDGAVTEIGGMISSSIIVVGSAGAWVVSTSASRSRCVVVVGIIIDVVVVLLDRTGEVTIDTGGAEEEVVISELVVGVTEDLVVLGEIVVMLDPMVDELMMMVVEDEIRLLVGHSSHLA